MSPVPEEQDHMATEHGPSLCEQANDSTNPGEAVKSIQSLSDLEDVAVGAGEVAMRIVGKIMQVASIAGVEGGASKQVATSDQAEKCAILPWESSKTLALSDISCKLSRVRRFLEKEIGYALLDDALHSNGTVRLGKPVERQLPGHVAPSRQDPEQDETKDAWVLPNMAQFAKYPDDLILVMRFMDTFEGAATRAKGEATCKAILQGVRLMHSCKYRYADIVVTLAYTSVYFRETVDRVNQDMCDYEAAHVCALLMFLAHSFILDQTCPLKFWQEAVFKHYCSVKVLNKALFRLFNLLNFQLRITADDEKRALSALLRQEEEDPIVA